MGLKLFGQLERDKDLMPVAEDFAHAGQCSDDAVWGFEEHACLAHVAQCDQLVESFGESLRRVASEVVRL